MLSTCLACSGLLVPAKSDECEAQLPSPWSLLHPDAAAALVATVLQTPTRVMNLCCLVANMFCRRKQFANTARVLLVQRCARLNAFQFVRSALLNSPLVTMIESMSARVLEVRHYLRCDCVCAARVCRRWVKLLVGGLFTARGVLSG